MAGAPSFWARLLRQQSELDDRRRVDLDHLLTWAEIEFAELPVNGFLGMHICVDGQHGILIKRGQNHGQRRFTIAHELGHFAIPHHSSVGVRQCLEDDVLEARVTVSIEREANEFAAELLMPRAFFVQDIASKSVCFRSVRKLAGPECYDVSVTACALRWIKLCRDPCALICTERGRIKWKWGGAKFRYALPPTGSHVPAESLAAAILRSETASEDASPVPTWSWIEPRTETVEVLESTFRVPSLDQILSMLLVVEEDREGEPAD